MNILFTAHRLFLVRFAMVRFAVVLVAILSIAAGPARAEAPRRKPNLENAFALVEYFTSDNCIRCREATEVIRAIDAEARESGKNVFLISQHVDYLNDEVWKDRLATAEATERQKQFAKQFKQRRVAPGTVVVSARQYLNGDQREAIDAAIAKELGRKPVATVHPVLERGADVRALSIEFKVKGIERIRRPFFTVLIALTEPVVEQLVASGNNAGQTFRHVNSVRVLATRRISQDGIGSAELQLPEEAVLDGSEVVIFVQDPQNNAILGAARARVPSAR